MTGGWDGALVDVGVIGWSADGWARRQLQRHGAEDTEGLQMVTVLASGCPVIGSIYDHARFDC